MHKELLVIGAGRSSYYLHKYLGERAKMNHWKVTVADRDFDAAKSMCFTAEQEPVQLDIRDVESLVKSIHGKKLVVSMLPAHLHFEVIESCVARGIHVITASYLSDEIASLHEKAIENNTLVLNELGLDPGIDHLSAMQLIDRIRKQGGQIMEFESFTGGLIAPESDDNPWHYKFTWNPRNVVLAGQGTAVKFIQNGTYKYIPYHRLFRRTEIIDIPQYGKFEGYANRDSLKYRETYGLQDVLTMYRGTLRRPGFCRAWNCLIDLGATDDSYQLTGVDSMTHRDFINTFLAYNPNDTVELKLRQYLKIDQDDVDLWEKLEYLGIFSHDLVGLKEGSPAQILQHILEKKWKLNESDKDMIVMWHKLVYRDMASQTKELNASLVVIGESRMNTAMAKTVGLPLAIGCRLIMEDKIDRRGCVLPVTKDIYEPILDELVEFGIVFEEDLKN
jgi:saccharopine dehydrogenase-like NADP-dependent oxidoreductase